jgi:hypothetical protein
MPSHFNPLLAAAGGVAPMPYPSFLLQQSAFHTLHQQMATNQALVNYQQQQQQLHQTSPTQHAAANFYTFQSQVQQQQQQPVPHLHSMPSVSNQSSTIQAFYNSSQALRTISMPVYTPPFLVHPLMVRFSSACGLRHG